MAGGLEKTLKVTQEETNADDGQTAAARAFTITQMLTIFHASIELAAHRHVQKEEWKDRHEIVPWEKENMQFVLVNKEARKHTERSFAWILSESINVHEMWETKHEPTESWKLSWARGVGQGLCSDDTLCKAAKEQNWRA